ncbi:tetracenomycin polyketide synthesis O-methyltransferase tcmP [Apiospora kogelbergensis]|uniref:Tetracenomycin polyketide synthesis O-methyltransferase tcmP n=1 Tax=Apiospora kogelbergensis TaxID=1337665 RepID=A0AAW0QSK5_9PEZI
MGTTDSPSPDESAKSRPSIAGSGTTSEININITPSLPKEKVILVGSEQTLLPMVMFKLRDAQGPNPILADPYARQLLERCDVDMDASHFKFTTDQRYVTWIANRAKRLDQWCQDFLDAHSEPVTVVHLACGLDCRFFRVNKSSRVRWIDIDQPLVVDLRSRLIPQPEGDYTLRTLDVAAPGWYKDIPADRPTLIIAEGLTPYLEPKDGKAMMRDLVEYFGGNGLSGQLIFDSLGSLSVNLTTFIKALRTSGSAFKWGIDEPGEILSLHPHLTMRDRIQWREFMDSHPPFFGPYGTPMASILPSFEKNIQFWRFDFI